MTPTGFLIKNITLYEMTEQGNRLHSHASFTVYLLL